MSAQAVEQWLNAAGDTVVAVLDPELRWRYVNQGARRLLRWVPGDAEQGGLAWLWRVGAPSTPGYAEAAARLRATGLLELRLRCGEPGGGGADAGPASVAAGGWCRLPAGGARHHRAGGG